MLCSVYTYKYREGCFLRKSILLHSVAPSSDPTFTVDPVPRFASDRPDGKGPVRSACPRAKHPWTGEKRRDVRARERTTKVGKTEAAEIVAEKWPVITNGERDAAGDTFKGREPASTSVCERRKGSAAWELSTSRGNYPQRSASTGKRARSPFGAPGSCVPRLCIKRNGLTDMLNPLSYRFTSTHFGEIASTLCAILTETDGNACSSHPELHCWFHVPRSPMCIHISQTILLNSPAVWPFRAIPAPTFR